MQNIQKQSGTKKMSSTNVLEMNEVRRWTIFTFTGNSKGEHNLIENLCTGFFKMFQDEKSLFL